MFLLAVFRGRRGLWFGARWVPGVVPERLSLIFQAISPNYLNSRLHGFSLTPRAHKGEVGHRRGECERISLWRRDFTRTKCGTILAEVEVREPVAV